ncbi:hypothetical protein C8J56DRAFT_453559 [Mycena floridula]|nr:hypothetical protein C8J56DRAFT_453559 [Mycena floridula]
MSRSFRFVDLSPELALEIISFAATPTMSFKTCRPSYTTALSLASVSHLMYRATMPHLLHTIACTSTEQLKSFVHSFHQNRRQVDSRFAPDYAALVKQVWLTDIWEPLVDCDDDIDYRALYEIFRNVDQLDISFNSMHLLYNSLTSIDPSAGQWSCRRLVLSGKHWRWSPLTSTVEGQAFLQQLTHLALWVPCHEVSSWLSSIPFESMSALTRFSFPLLSSGSIQQYHRTTIIGNKDIFVDWKRTGQYEGDMMTIAIEIPEAVNFAWDDAYAYALEENARVWDTEKSRGRVVS